MFVSPIIQWVIRILYPLVWVLEQVIYALKRMVWAEGEKVSKEDVEIFVEEWKKAEIFTNTEALIIHNFLEFSERDVESVFQHRKNVFALDEEITLADATQQILGNPYSRVPLYRWDKDTLVAMLTLRDVLLLNQNPTNLSKSLKEFSLRAVEKVPITASIFDVFLDMKKHGQHFAVVIDEYWGTAWIVTFEDILEDMVWAIRDESDGREDAEIVKIDDSSCRVQWGTILRDIIDILQISWYKVPDEYSDISEEDTVAYVILEVLKDFAKKWEIIHLGDLTFEVLKVNKEWDAIKKVKVSYIEKNEESERIDIVDW